MKTEVAYGWGLRVGGGDPYLGYHFSIDKKSIESIMTESYHRAVKVAIVPLSEWKRLKKLDMED